MKNQTNVELLPHFSIKNREVWEEFVLNNEPGLVLWTARWACHMETAMADNLSVALVATRCEAEIDPGYHSGFSFGHTVNVLAQCWSFGDELKAWYEAQKKKYLL